MPDKTKVIIGLCAFALMVIIVILIAKRPKMIIEATSLESDIDLEQIAAPQEPVTPPPAVPAPVVEFKLQADPLPPMPSIKEAPSTQSVDAHRAELLRGSAKTRSRATAPTTSALIMSAALSGLEKQSSRQNIGETAVMDRMMRL